jgi:hypothetical protein
VSVVVVEELISLLVALVFFGKIIPPQPIRDKKPLVPKLNETLQSLKL